MWIEARRRREIEIEEDRAWREERQRRREIEMKEDRVWREEIKRMRETSKEEESKENKEWGKNITSVSY